MCSPGFVCCMVHSWFIPGHHWANTFLNLESQKGNSQCKHNAFWVPEKGFKVVNQIINIFFFRLNLFPSHCSLFIQFGLKILIFGKRMQHIIYLYGGQKRRETQNQMKGKLKFRAWVIAISFSNGFRLAWRSAIITSCASKSAGLTNWWTLCLYIKIPFY